MKKKIINREIKEIDQKGKSHFEIIANKEECSAIAEHFLIVKPKKSTQENVHTARKRT